MPIYYDFILIGWVFRSNLDW